MNKKNLKLIMELIFIFILPLVFICFTSQIQVEREFTYDNNGNYETSQDTKSLAFDNSIIKYTKQSNGKIWEETNIIQLNGNPLLINTKIKINKNLEEMGIINLYEYTSTHEYYIYIATEGGMNENQYNLVSFNDITNENITPLILISNEENYYIFQLTTQFNYLNESNYNILNNFEIETDGIITTNTIWGNIKELLINNLELNDNVLLDIVLCYTILWFIMWIIWHLFYGLFELLWHVIPEPIERRM